MVGDDDNSGALLFALIIEPNLLHPRWAERFGDEPCRVVIPFNDVDLLTLELVHDLAHPRTAGPNTCANRVDIVVVRCDSDLRAVTSLSRNGLDLDISVDQFGNLQLEERPDELGMAP